MDAHELPVYWRVLVNTVYRHGPAELGLPAAILGYPPPNSFMLAKSATFNLGTGHKPVPPHVIVLLGSQ